MTDRAGHAPVFKHFSIAMAMGHWHGMIATIRPLSGSSAGDADCDGIQAAWTAMTASNNTASKLNDAVTMALTQRMTAMTAIQTIQPANSTMPIAMALTQRMTAMTMMPIQQLLSMMRIAMAF